MKAQSGDEYVAGLWREGLESQLCWDTGYDGGGGRISQYVAPTWSWASVYGYVNFHKANLEPSRHSYAKIQSIDIKYASTDPFGEIRSANLRLSCEYLLKGIIIHHPFNSEGTFGADIEFGGTLIYLPALFDCWESDDQTPLVYILPIKGPDLESE